MYYNSKEFIKNRPMYYQVPYYYQIDTTRHPENISNSKGNILNTVDFQTAINQNEIVTAYTLVVSEK